MYIHIHNEYWDRVKAKEPQYMGNAGATLRFVLHACVESCVSASQPTSIMHALPLTHTYIHAATLRYGA